VTERGEGPRSARPGTSGTRPGARAGRAASRAGMCSSLLRGGRECEWCGGGGGGLGPGLLTAINMTYHKLCQFHPINTSLSKTQYSMHSIQGTEYKVHIVYWGNIVQSSTCQSLFLVGIPFGIKSR
jgi:hypothetical protein